MGITICPVKIMILFLIVMNERHDASAEIAEPKCLEASTAGRLSGTKTTCVFFLNRMFSSLVYRGPPTGRAAAMIFIRELSSKPIVVQDQRMDDCPKSLFTSEPSGDSRQWTLDESGQSKVTPRELDEVRENPNQYCLFVKFNERYGPNTFPLHVVYKLSRDHSEFAANPIAYSVPNKSNYLIVDKKPDVDRICTACVDGGTRTFGQGALLKRSRNLTHLLNTISG